MNDPFDTLIIRPGAPGDIARVRKDWLLSYATSAFARMCSPGDRFPKRASELYFAWQKQVMDRLLGGDADLWVATWTEDTTTIVGWTVTSPCLLHYVYVGEDYRHHGVAKRLLAPLLEEPRVTYTHRSTIAKHLPIPPGWTFDKRPAVVGPQKETRR